MTALSLYQRTLTIYCVSLELNINLPTGFPIRKSKFFFGKECSQTYQNNQQFALFAAVVYWIVVCPSNLQRAEKWRLEAIPQFRKTCGYASLRTAFLRDRICGNVAYTSVSRNGYLSFRWRKLEFPLRNHCTNGPGNS